MAVRAVARAREGGRRAGSLLERRAWALLPSGFMALAPLDAPAGAPADDADAEAPLVWLQVRAAPARAVRRALVLIHRLRCRPEAAPGSHRARLALDAGLDIVRGWPGLAENGRPCICLEGCHCALCTRRMRYIVRWPQANNTGRHWQPLSALTCVPALLNPRAARSGSGCWACVRATACCCCC